MVDHFNFHSWISRLPDVPEVFFRVESPWFVLHSFARFRPWEPLLKLLFHINHLCFLCSNLDAGPVSKWASEFLTPVKSWFSSYDYCWLLLCIAQGCPILLLLSVLWLTCLDHKKSRRYLWKYMPDICENGLVQTGVMPHRFPECQP